MNNQFNINSKIRNTIIIIASLLLVIVAVVVGIILSKNSKDEDSEETSIVLEDNLYENWSIYNNYIDAPIDAPIVLDKQQGILLKYRYTRDIIDNKTTLLIKCTDSCIKVMPSGIDGIYSNAYMVISVSGVYKGEAVIQIVDESDNLIDEIMVTVTNNTFVD